GFDWLLGDFGVGYNGINVSGGVAGNSNGNFGADQYPFVNPLADGAPAGSPQSPVGVNPVTAGLRTGDMGIIGSAIDALISNGRVGAVASNALGAPGIFGIAGMLTDPQFQVVMRGLSQKKGTDLLSAPKITTKSGQRGRIEVIRELIYPTEYDPPELPQQVGSDIVGGGGDGGEGGGGVSSFPVTPANPTAFTTRSTGVTMEVDPQIGPDGYTVDLTLAPEVVEFDGFVNYGSPITATGTNQNGQPIQVVITENRIEMPVFSTRRVTTAVTVWDGHTVAIGGLMREDVQHVQDKVPLLGDLPYVGRLFRSESEQRQKRNLMVFVTVKLIDPSGQLVNKPIEPEADVAPESVGPDPGLFPPAGKAPIYSGKQPLY
ncbi:MAG: type II and III secretion system protein, partial [Verrucomicrobiota bacterium]